MEEVRREHARRRDNLNDQLEEEVGGAWFTCFYIEIKNNIA